MDMFEKNTSYSDLSLQADKAIDVSYLLNKIRGNGYSTVALDYELADPKQ